jgi:hypothetical protein
MGLDVGRGQMAVGLCYVRPLERMDRYCVFLCLLQVGRETAKCFEAILGKCPLGDGDCMDLGEVDEEVLLFLSVCQDRIPGSLGRAKL